jgi:hypothetical protein
MDVLRRHLFDSVRYQPSMMMRCCKQAFAIAIVVLATPSVAAPIYGNQFLQHVQNSRRHQATLPLVHVSDTEPDTTVFAIMSGKCPTLKIAGRDFRCRAVAFYQTELGRANFAIALDDPADKSHIITFSGDNGRRLQDSIYELPIDRMLLNSNDRPKVDGLPVPFVELSTGMCKQLGNFKEREVSSISCTAMDKDGRKYELQYQSDGSPITLRRVRRMRAGQPAMSPFD